MKKLKEIVMMRRRVRKRVIMMRKMSTKISKEYEKEE